MINSWEELLQRELRIDIEETRAEMVRVSVIAYLGCMVTGFLSLSVAQWSSTLGSVAVITVAALTAAGLWLGRRRVPVWVLVMQAPYAAALLALGLGAGVSGSTSMYSLFYMLVILYGTFFLRTEVAGALVVLCSLAFAAAAIGRGDPDWLPMAVLVFGTSVTVGLFSGLLVKRFHERAVRDNLTGLLNRRMWESLVQQELNRAERSRRPFSILIVDLDGFKAINDEFGHLHGDRILKQVGDVLRRVLRGADAPCRWGGDEFTVLLSECGEEEVWRVADRIRTTLGDELSLSVGAATWRQGATLKELFQQADQSLYEAKANKRAA